MKTFVKLTNDGNLLVAGQQVTGPDYTLKLEDYNQPGLIRDGWYLVVGFQAKVNQAFKRLPKTVGGPRTVSAAQARIALAQAGLLASIEQTIAELPATNPTSIAWNYATEFTEDSPTLLSLCEELDLTEAQRTELFTSAAQVVI